MKISNYYNNENQYYVYILASKKNGTLYIGVTSDLVKRAYEHKNNIIDGFTKKYNIHKLVYYEISDDIESAREWHKEKREWQRRYGNDIKRSGNDINTLYEISFEF